MARQQHLKLCLRVQDGDDIAGAVGANLIGIGCHFPDDLFLQANLVAGYGHGVQHFKQEFFVHGCPLLFPPFYHEEIGIATYCKDRPLGRSAHFILSVF